MTNPESAAPAQSSEQPQGGSIALERPGSVVPPGSKFYVVRHSDEVMERALQRKGTIILIKGGRQMGMTSLIVRSLDQVRAAGAITVYTDLGKLSNSDFESIQQFYIALAHSLADQLDVETQIEDRWSDRRAPNINFERYLLREVMPKAGGHLFWALDAVDRLAATDFGSEVFGLFRSFHIESTDNPDTPWGNLSVIIAHSTEAHLLINDAYRSAFNVGERIELQDFSREQVEALNQLYGSPLATAELITRFYDLVGGQPYLVRLGLNELAARATPFEEFEAAADSDEGLFGDPLRRILGLMARDPEMTEAVRTVLDGGNNLSVEAFQKLRAAGIVYGQYATNAKMRCDLYARYLSRHLKEPAG